MIARGASACAMALALAGCSTTGPIVFNCDGFEGDRGYGQAEVSSAYVRQIRGEPEPPAPAPSPAAAAQAGPGKAWNNAAPASLDNLEAAIAKAEAETPLPAEKKAPAFAPSDRILTLDDALDRMQEDSPPPKPDKNGGHDPLLEWSGHGGGEMAGPVAADLLLSGGGQWGAFGAGFLAQLHRQGFAREYKFSIVTGVSTGAFQAMFVGAGSDQDYQTLEAVYHPPQESQLVRRYRPTALAVLTGEMAAIGRLRGQLEDRLCNHAALDQAVKAGGTLSRADVERICPLIGGLAKAGLVEDNAPIGTRPKRLVFIGMVRADDGRFIAANATQIALDVYRKPTTPDRLRNAQQCLAAVGLASAAMPLFYQQVKIGDNANKVPARTYYDGGVRQSVFEAKLAATPANGKARRPIFVLRNGPTSLLTREGDQDQPGADTTANGKADALTAAMRAEKIVVNQVEVQSIADLRLTNPEGPVYFTTADGFHQFKGADGRTCSKTDKDAMFDPAFMTCLHQFGVATARKGDTPKHLIDAWRRLKTASEVKDLR